MDIVNSCLNLVVPPASAVMLALAWPALLFINACEWVYGFFVSQDMEEKVVVITGASSGIGEHIAYEYAKRRAILVLVARREDRLRGISKNAKWMGAKHVMIVAADVVKEDECRRFISDAVNIYGCVDHLVNATSLMHTFYFEEATDTSVFPHLLDINFWGNVYPTYVALPYLRQSRGRIIAIASVENWIPLPRMSLYSAAKSALVNFYETLRLELKDEVGITIATHGWVGAEVMRGKFKFEEGATETQWKEERDASNGAQLDEFAKLIVDGACRGDPYVKFPSWEGVSTGQRYMSARVAASSTDHEGTSDYGREGKGGGGSNKKTRNVEKAAAWVPHPRNGIYFPEGHDWVIADVLHRPAPLPAGKSYWLRNVDGIEKPDPDLPTDHYLNLASQSQD